MCVCKEREKMLSLLIFLGKKVSAHSILFSLKSISRLKWSHKGNFFSKKKKKKSRRTVKKSALYYEHMTNALGRVLYITEHTNLHA
jgi:hypothetical protein